MVESIIAPVTSILELAGLAAIALGTLWATLIAGRGLVARSTPPGRIFHDYRLNLSRGILLGLELLVAADITGTLIVDPTFESLGVLGLIVVVRTFLSFTLEVEVTGRWPWQARPPAD